MDIEEQQSTYSAFMKYSVRSTVAIVLVLVLLAAFVA